MNEFPSPQLPLDLSLHRGQSFENFWAGSNALLVSLLGAIANGDYRERQVVFWGGRHSGKSHLLNALCRGVGARGAQATCINASMIRSRDMLTGLEQLDVIGIDDLQCLPRQPESELALFGLINALQRSDCRLVCAASCPVSELPIRLPDLRTRLGWGAGFALRAVTHQDLPAVISLRARAAGLSLDEGVVDYLLNHYSRDLASIVERLEQIDKGSLQAKRRITIPFVRQLLNRADTQGNPDPT